MRDGPGPDAVTVIEENLLDAALIRALMYTFEADETPIQRLAYVETAVKDHLKSLAPLLSGYAAIAKKCRETIGGRTEQQVYTLIGVNEALSKQVGALQAQIHAHFIEIADTRLEDKSPAEFTLETQLKMILADHLDSIHYGMESVGGRFKNETLPTILKQMQHLDRINEAHQHVGKLLTDAADKVDLTEIYSFTDSTVQKIQKLIRHVMLWRRDHA